ncbi:MAG: hypothetical protein KJ955_01510 [Nanoarchaeota archaeon]|nr:hypothetical protein [Nanoarchaeota archaeon]
MPRIGTKRKGTKAERELFHLFWENSWGCARIAGSGSTRRPSTDLIAGNANRLLAVECKSISKPSWYFSKEDIEKLATFAASMGAEPWIGVRFDNIGWYFVHLDNLKESKGESFVVSLDFAERHGLNFDEMIGKYSQEKLL